MSQKTLVFSTLVQTLLLVVLAAAILVVPGKVWPYLLFILLSGIAAVFFQISFQSIVPEICGRNEFLYEANSRLALSDAAMRIIGPAVAGVMIGALSAFISLSTIAVCSALSMLMFIIIKSPHAAVQQKEHSNIRTYRPSNSALIKEGFRYVWNNRWLNPIILCGAYYIIFITAIKASISLYVVQYKDVSTTVAGIMVGCIAGGYAIGSVIGKRMSVARGPRISLQLGALISTAGVFSSSIASVYFSGSLVVLVTAMLLAAHGIGEGMFAPNALSVRQIQTPQALMSRVTAVHRFLIWGGMALGGLVATIASHFGSVGTTLVCSGIGIWGTLPLLYRRELALQMNSHG